MASDIRLICFDLGRVIVRICDGWQQALEAAGISGVRVPELGPAQKATMHELIAASEVGRLSQNDFYHRAGKLLGIDPGHVAAMSDVWILSTYPGVVELLDAIGRAGLKTACLSNTNGNHWSRMSDPASPCFVPFDRMDWCFPSHLVGARKPDPAVYQHVERTTGFSTGQIIFFDDLPENIAPARHRGWIAELIAYDGDPIRQVRRHLVRLGVLGG